VATWHNLLSLAITSCIDRKTQVLEKIVACFVWHHWNLY
jgi:hypothetical protein